MHAVVDLSAILDVIVTGIEAAFIVSSAMAVGIFMVRGVKFLWKA